MVRCSLVEFSYRTIVDQPLHLSNRVRRDLGDIGPFRDETSDDSDPVFHRPLVLAGVWTGEIGLNAEHPRNLLMTAERLVVVERDGMDRMRHFAQCCYQSLLYPFAMLAVEFSNLGVKGRPVCDHQDGALPVPAHHQVGFVVSRTHPVSDNIRTLLDGHTTRYRPPGILDPATLAAPAPMLQEAVKSVVGAVFRLMASLTFPYPLIQALMAYRTQTRLTTDGADDLRTPSVMHQSLASLLIHAIREARSLRLLVMAPLRPKLSLAIRVGPGIPAPRRHVASKFPSYRGGMDPDGLCNRFLADSCFP